MSRVAWKFEDPVTSDVYFLPVNPKADTGSNARTRELAYSVNAGLRQQGDGVDTIDNLVYESNKPQRPFAYEGFAYTKEQYDAWNEWANKGYPILMTDDLGREFTVYITSLLWSRVRSRQFPYKHSYKFSGIILD
jgi:hypothetical protein